MWFMDISIAQKGTDVEAVENLLLEMFERYEKTEVRVIEKPLQSITGTSFKVYRYRVHAPTGFDVRGSIETLTERLKLRTRSDIHITHPQSFAIFGVDAYRGKY